VTNWRRTRKGERCISQHPRRTRNLLRRENSLNFYKTGRKASEIIVAYRGCHSTSVQLKRKRLGVLSEIGLTDRPVDLRCLETIEWNLLGNREGWGKTSSFEMTNTRFGGSRSPYLDHLAIGGPDNDGKTYVFWATREYSHKDKYSDGFGFHVAVVLGTGQNEEK
jgi:hypothetical protein